jgi:hypothetical protein
MFNRYRSIFLITILVCAFVYTGYLFIDFLGKSIPVVSALLKAGGQHDQLRDSKISYNHAVSQAARLIPPSEYVMISKRNGLRNIDFIAIRYAVYPAKVSEPFHYYFDVKGSDPWPDQTWQARPLDHGAVLYAEPGHLFLDHQKPIVRSAWKEGAVFLLITVFMIWIGWNILLIIGIGPDVLGIMWFLSSGYLTGFVLVNNIYWILFMIGIRLDLFTVVSVLVVLWIATVFVRKMIKTQGSVLLSGSMESIRKKDLWFWAGHWAVNRSVLIVVLFMVMATVSIPITFWDEMLIWILRSKMLFYHGNIDFPYVGATNVYYPILWPLHIHVFFKAAGGCYSEILKWVSASVLLVFVGQLLGASAFLNFKRVSSGLPVLLFLLLFMNLIFFTALPEVVFFALSLGVVVPLMFWLREPERKRFLALSVMMGIGLAGIKFEGGLIVLVIAVCCALAGRSVNLPISRYLRLFWFLIPGLIPWFWISWLKANGFQYTVYHFGSPLVSENMNAIFYIVIESLSHGRNLGIVFFLTVFYLIFKKHEPLDSVQRFMILVFLALAGFSVFSVVFWPTEDIRLYYPKVLDRLFLRAVPFLIMVWASLVFERIDSSERGKP